MNELIDKFQEISEQYASNIALVSEYEGEFTYKELNEYANYIAEELLKLKDRGKVAGICMERSFTMIAAILGVLKAGMAYLPLDPSYPQERLLYMAKKSEIITVILKEHTNLPIKNSLLLDCKYRFREKNIVTEYNALTYVLYTSGSTGSPKGVMVKSKSIMNTINWRIQYYGLDCTDTALQIPSFSFSSSIEDIFSTLLCGGKLVMLRARDLINIKKLSYFIRKYKVTHFLMVPSLYSQLLPYLKDTELRFIVLAGEVLRTELIENHFTKHPEISLYNEYGMTETSVAFSACQVNLNSQPYLIGKPITNMEYVIKDKDDCGIGELVVLGIGVAEGYHNEEHDVTQKFGFQNGRKAFFTGDYVKENEQGELIYYGRNDQQIKVNGQRINLSEIDAAVLSIADISDVITTPIKVGDKSKILCLIKTETVGIEEEIKNKLYEILPLYYIPDYINLGKDFYHLPNGKVDVVKMREEFLNRLIKEEIVNV